nr:hypothetical protein [Dyella sp. ASV24]
MTEYWYILGFALFAVLGPIFASFISMGGDDDTLVRSLADQTVSVGGQQLPGSKLEVIYRPPAMQERYGCNASWICRTPDGAYLLAMAQGEVKRGVMVVTWTWRQLTEERARQAMVNDQKAYRAAFHD